MKFLLLSPERLKADRSAIAFILAVSILCIGIVILLHFGQDVSIGKLTRDLSTIAKVPLYIGFLSQIGIFFWSAAIAICIYTAKLISRRPNTRIIRRFFFASGLLTLLLSLDDAFMLHESFFPSVGIPEKLVFVSYAGLVFLYLARFYSTILKTEYIFLGIALLFFGLSISCDYFKPRWEDLSLLKDGYLLEDGAKFIGIVSWLTYLYRSALLAVYQNTPQQDAALDDNSPMLYSRR
ncbi:MAG: hypothetical protein AAGG51_20450 [Cyanobacteria bacterium P01_G01_bin.54]